eukprot:10958286-Alexandrium_andersonii.AAC.1
MRRVGQRNATNALPEPEVCCMSATPGVDNKRWCLADHPSANEHPPCHERGACQWSLFLILGVV